MSNDIAKKLPNGDILIEYTGTMTEEDGALVRSLGQQITVWAFGCNPSVLDNPEALCAPMRDYVLRNGLTIREECLHKYSPQGVTAVLILAESHLLINTWPEHRVAQIELYSCKRVDRDSMVDTITNSFDAERVSAYLFD